VKALAVVGVILLHYIICWILFRIFFPKNSESAESSLKPKPTDSTARPRKEWSQIKSEVQSATTWYEKCKREYTTSSESGRWFTVEQRQELEGARPELGLEKTISSLGLWKNLTEVEIEAVRWLSTDLKTYTHEHNINVRDWELRSHHDFFTSFERRPLTLEQATSVICTDNRVHLIAAAGSGKTTVIVARAAYAVKRKLYPPERILLLAFNRSTAGELNERVKERFTAAGLPYDGLLASTFHSFALKLVGDATGEKPRVAPWAENGAEQKILDIVGFLKEKDAQFSHAWDLYRLIFSSTPLDPDDALPDAFDREKRRSGFQTIRGDIVKSHGERMIADWLFLHNVPYEYERYFSENVFTSRHSQYRPDFYYPTINVWHEHWAICRNGRPPKAFPGYADQMRWKRELHKKSGTTLIETTFDSVVNGDGLTKLEANLRKFGIIPRWEPTRSGSRSRLTPSDEALARQIRRFMTHVKSNGLSKESLKGRLKNDFKHLEGTRTDTFLFIYWKIHDAWQAELYNNRYIDFDDLLTDAAKILESDAFDAGFDMILVDEFQDSSQARARLIRGLLRKRGRSLLAVGDDWQSINAFAGSDIFVLSNFETVFGEGPQLFLSTTFRCTQDICDVSSAFIQENPTQLRKAVQSYCITPGKGVKVIIGEDPKTDLSKVLFELSERTSNGDFSGIAGRRPKVMILGRYRRTVRDMPQTTPGNLQVEFMTVHGSKGLEADIVVIAGVVAGRFGFPCEIDDDVVLNLAMAKPDEFPDAEERRLFYVALTRARMEVIILTQEETPSPFVIEIIDRSQVSVSHVRIKDFEKPLLCPCCGKGSMRTRAGEYGLFFGCSRFPSCTHTMKITNSRFQDSPATHDP
jgi:DNA helicase IV